MKKNQVNAILVDEAKRKNKIIGLSCIAIIVSLLAFVFFYMFINNKKIYYVSYTEDSDIDYKVYLKQNDFFDSNYLNSDNQYIASLIDNITATFNYKLNVDDDKIQYKYQYYIEAEVNVKDKNTNKSIYNFKEKLVDEELNNSSSSTVQITKDVEIDYNKYNELIKKFVSVYNLEDSISTLNVKMFVKVLGECEKVEDIDKTSTFSLNIPLTTKTVAIDLEKKLVDTNKENFMSCNNDKTLAYISLAIMIVFVIADVIVLTILIKYIIKTRTAETIYHKELKKILNNYKSYIQKINNTFDLKGYQVLGVDSFTDMLEIRDTLQQPILMAENKENTGVYFIIPSSTKILYLYSLKVSTIKRKMKNNTLNEFLKD